jgi:hypothetical protein
MVKLPDQRIVSCGDMSCEFLIDPIPRPRPAPLTVTMQPARREVLFVDHGKPNSHEILVRAQRILRNRGVAVADDIPRKPSASEPMGAAMLDELAARGALILCGVSD